MWKNKFALLPRDKKVVGFTWHLHSCEDGNLSLAWQLANIPVAKLGLRMCLSFLISGFTRKEAQPSGKPIQQERIRFIIQLRKAL